MVPYPSVVLESLNTATGRPDDQELAELPSSFDVSPHTCGDWPIRLEVYRLQHLLLPKVKNGDKALVI